MGNCAICKHKTDCCYTYYHAQEIIGQEFKDYETYRTKGKIVTTTYKGFEPKAAYICSGCAYNNKILSGLAAAVVFAAASIYFIAINPIDSNILWGLLSAVIGVGCMGE